MICACEIHFFVGRSQWTCRLADVRGRASTEHPELTVKLENYRLNWKIIELLGNPPAIPIAGGQFHLF